MNTEYKRTRLPAFVPVTLSLADLLGREQVSAVCRARAVLTGGSVSEAMELAQEAVDFLPRTFLQQQVELLARVGEKVVEGRPQPAVRGAGSRAFEQATDTTQAPLSACGLFRIGEDGRLRLITKSEHYHTPLGHAFPGYTLIDRARQLGIPNATHNNTRGTATRMLEENLLCAAHGLDPRDPTALEDILRRQDPFVVNRVLNLETGSLAVEAALKMILARFHRFDSSQPSPKYAGRTPVLLVVGTDEGGLQANYHGTTVATQILRGLWPDLEAGLHASGLLRILPVRPNRLEDVEAAFAREEGSSSKVAGFLHEIIMMNYGGRRLTPEFLGAVYAICRRHDVPTVADEIQSCLWHHDLFMFREWGLTPSFVAVGKGFPGGEYPASRLLFSSALDSLPQFGALVTNGQEELAAIAYAITMRWAQANARTTRTLGDYYEHRLRALAGAHPGTFSGVDGRRHLSTLGFRDLATAKQFVHLLVQRGLDLSVQTYKADCPPVVLTKIPLTSTPEVIDFILECLEEAVSRL